MGSRVLGFGLFLGGGFRALGLGVQEFRVLGVFFWGRGGFRVWGLRFRVLGFLLGGFRALGFGVYGLGFWGFCWVALGL